MENLQALPLGTIIQGTSYKIEKILGQGNFGITYQVRHTVFDKVFAMKEFFPVDISDRNSSVSLMLDTPLRRKEEFETLKKKFVSEALALNECRHPGVVEIKDVLPSMNTIFYIMEYVDGVTLREKYTGKPLPAADAIALIKKIAAPLKYVHGRKIAHFDLNPNNVMITADGAVKLIDFGFSKRYDGTGQQKSSLLIAGGTPGYIAPEQIGGVIKEFTPSCDVFALGGILYFLLTGHAPVPFQELFIDEELLLKSLSAEFHDFFRRAMALNVRKRFSNVDEFVSALNETGDKNDNAWEDFWKEILTFPMNEKKAEDVKENKTVKEPKKTPDQPYNNMKIGLLVNADSSGEWKLVRRSKDNLWNYRNTEGEYLFQSWLQEANDFCEGYALVKYNEKYSFVDANGHVANCWFPKSDDPKVIDKPRPLGYCFSKVEITGMQYSREYIVESGYKCIIVNSKLIMIGIQDFDFVTYLERDMYLVTKERKSNIFYTRKNKYAVGDWWEDDVWFDEIIYEHGTCRGRRGKTWYKVDEYGNVSLDWGKTFKFGK